MLEFVLTILGKKNQKKSWCLHCQFIFYKTNASMLLITGYVVLIKKSWCLHCQFIFYKTNASMLLITGYVVLPRFMSPCLLLFPTNPTLF